MYFSMNAINRQRHSRCFAVCLAFFFVCCPPLLAQVNVFTDETMRQMRLESGFYNSMTLDLTYRGGNTDLLTARARFRSDYLGETYHGFIFGSIQQGRKNGEFFISKGMAHGRIIRDLTHHVLLEAFVQKQFNESILLNDRNLLGGGFRFAARPQNSRFQLYLGVGAMWEDEHINDSALGAITTRTVRSTNYINWTGQLDERLTTSATGYYQVSVSRFQDYRVLFEGSLTFSLTKKLAFPIRVNFRYDSEPPNGIQKYDVEIFNGLRYTF